jgi:hypothetical protein
MITRLCSGLVLALLAGACAPYPAQLAETGLFADIDSGALVPEAREYRPRFELWSDGAQKLRWLLLPDGETIDTSDMDAWRFPVGTKLFKQFTRGDQRLETRMLEKAESGEWIRVAYLWNDDHTAAAAVPAGTEGAHDTTHDVPSVDDCKRCHEGAVDGVLGVSALQLAHDDTDTSLQDLVDASLLSDPPADPGAYVFPDTMPAIFGHLHANCGGCHNGRTELETPLRLELTGSELAGAPEDTRIYQTTVDATVDDIPDGAPALDTIVVPGDTERSMLYQRFITRGEDWQMPPLATKSVDADAADALQAWIESL